MSACSTGFLYVSILSHATTCFAFVDLQLGPDLHLSEKNKENKARLLL